MDFILVVGRETDTAFASNDLKIVRVRRGYVHAGVNEVVMPWHFFFAHVVLEFVGGGSIFERRGW
jgi:hypothetical protein